MSQAIHARMILLHRARCLTYQRDDKRVCIAKVWRDSPSASSRWRMGPTFAPPRQSSRGLAVLEFQQRRLCLSRYDRYTSIPVPGWRRSGDDGQSGMGDSMISVAELIDELGYEGSPNFVTGDELGRVPGYGHIFRRAQQRRKEGEKSCGLQGVYTLRQRPSEDLSLGEGSLTPVVYVCEAASEADADQIHRLVWNQDVVPFLIVCTPQNVRVYSGFGYREDESAKKRSASRILKEAIGAQEIASKLLPSFSAQRIDDGTLWRDKGRFVTPDMRVDWRLLDRLKELGHVLRKDMKLPAQAAHALIGKYVYLRYLRDRDILSEKRLNEFQIDAQAVFSRNAQLSALRSLVEQLDDWLNGSVFEIPWKEGVKAEHVKQVAATFFGDDPKSGQGSLFEDYDFSYIPIETLSVVYEQFLHAEGRGKDAGAYYTPIPLVNFILDEMEASLPFTKGMRALDPACGSGAFLVQCYRRLIEKELLKRKGERFRPVELRELLQGHIFGIDRDEDACQVTELSLILTLLDYVDPPDLTKTNFKLPKLRGVEHLRRGSQRLLQHELRVSPEDGRNQVRLARRQSALD